jgi:hypothetical protein
MAVDGDEGAARGREVLRFRAPRVVEVEVLGEDQRRKADLHGTLACPSHRPCAGEGGPPVSQDHSLCTWVSAGSVTPRYSHDQ